jgi:hypothetical protein
MVDVPRPNVSDVNDEGLQDTGAPTPEVLARRALEQARAEGRHPRLEDLADLHAHHRRVRGAEL